MKFNAQVYQNKIDRIWYEVNLLLIPSIVKFDMTKTAGSSVISFEIRPYLILRHYSDLLTSALYSLEVPGDIKLKPSRFKRYMKIMDSAMKQLRQILEGIKKHSIKVSVFPFIRRSRNLGVLAIGENITESKMYKKNHVCSRNVPEYLRSYDMVK